MILDFSFAQDTVGYIIEDTMDAQAMKDLRNEVKRKFEKFDSINLYLEDCGIDKITFSASLLGAMFPLEHAKKFRKIALVTDRKWIHAMAYFDNLFIEGEIKSFKGDQRMDAMSWITE